MDNYTFVNSEFFYLLIIPIAILIWYALKYKSYSSNILFSETNSISRIITLKQRLRHLPYLLKAIASVLLVIAIARPQSSSNWEEMESQRRWTEHQTPVRPPLFSDRHAASV